MSVDLAAGELALQWVEGSLGIESIAALSTASLRDLARSIKGLCNDHWNSEPERARHAADRLRQLDSRHDPVVRAMVHWSGALADLTQGRMHEALKALDQARGLLHEAGEAHEAVRCLLPRMVALVMLGRHEEALADGGAARQAFIELSDPVAAGKADLNLGSMLLRLDRHRAAADVYRQAAVLFARARDPLHSVMADIGLASACSGLFDFEEALRLYERASHRVQARGLHSLQGVIDTNRGRLELLLGQHASALARLNAALREAEGHGLPQDIAEARRDLADAYLTLNLLPEAVALYDQTLEICQRTDAPVEAAWAQVQRAQAVAQMGEPAAALDDLRSARTAFLAADHAVGAAVADLRSAAARLAMGQALEAYSEASAATTTFIAHEVEAWRWEARWVSAGALHAMGRLEEAQAAYEEILQAGTVRVEVHTAARTGLALVLRALGRLEEARAHFEEAVLATEQQRAALPGDEFRTAYGADKQAPYDALIELALDDPPQAESSARLLAAIEQARAPALLAALRQRDQASPSDPQLRERWHWLQAQWQQAVAEDDRARSALLQSRMTSLEKDWLEQVRRRQATARLPDRHQATASGSATALEAAALAAIVPPGTAVVAYALVGDRMVACVATSTGLRHAESSASGLAARIEQLRFQIDTMRHQVPALQAHAPRMAQRCRAHLQALHEQVWRPVEPLLGDCTRVVIVPHRILHYLPFAALHDGRSHLLERLEITMAPSVGLWAGGPQRPAAPVRHLAAFGVGGEALPQVRQEVLDVAATFTADPSRSVSVHLEGQATHAALRAALADADVLHLACHGQFRADSPYFSALHLADGPLTVRDAAELPLRARLVVLSACETSLSKVAPGDELLGLLRGFLMAGARQVLATQWTVDDASARTLMASFYRGWLGGLEPAAALRAAQARLILQEPHPYHWAAFTLHERA